MDAAQFQVPVRLKLAAEADIQEIYSAEDAVELLFGWPQQEGPIYEDALAECLVATVSPENVEEARRAFVAFAKVSNILAKDPATAIIREMTASWVRH
ncbi:uncharacterized protein DUF982 [Mesorhizobium sp. J18]|nr:uncharacterized protein DUF982 [Mesorhizobium sp. J18]